MVVVFTGRSLVIELVDGRLLNDVHSSPSEFVTIGDCWVEFSICSLLKCPKGDWAEFSIAFAS